MELLEREHFLETLHATGPGHVVLVTGEAGIGKTSLARAFRDGTARVVLWGSCDALRTPRPLGPLHDIGRQAGGRLADVLAAEGSRHQIFTAFLDQLTADPAVVVVEDAQWADEATRDLLLFIGRRITSTQSLLIVTYRDDEVGSDHPLLAVLGAYATEPAVRQLKLPALSAQAVAALAAPHGLTAADLHARTGGNPFFVTEVLSDPGREVPATVRDAVLARAASLTAAEREALDSVAIFPGHAPVPLIQAAPEAVDACVRTGMLTRDGARIRFRHELARLAIDESIPPARRTGLHVRALADLSRRGAEPAVLAYHAEEAGDEESVLRHASAAAQRAVALGAHRQAADHYGQALRYAARLPAQDRAELLERYAEECAATGLTERALDISGQAIAYWRGAGNREREAAMLARRSHYLWGRGENKAAHKTVKDALSLAGQLPAGRGQAAAYTWSASLLVLVCDIPGALAAAAQAVELSERFGDEPLLARALNAIGAAHWVAEPAAAERLLTRSVDVARQAGDDIAVGSAMTNLGSGAGEIRRYPVAERWLREAIDWCSARDLDTSRWYATAWLARCLFERGDWAQAEALLAADDGFADAPARIVARSVLGSLRARRGDPGAEQALNEAWLLAQRTGDLQRLWPAAAGLAELAWLTGQQPGELVTRTYDLAVRVGHGWAIGELGQWLGQAHPAAAPPYLLGPVEAARAWDELGCPYEAALALILRPAQPRDVQAMQAQLKEALRRFERLGARPAADRVARHLRDLGIRSPRRSTLAHPDGLTAREQDVLGMLRLGLHNADIAVRLHIAQKTVDHHVSAILGKLGVPSRQAAARHGQPGKPT